MKQTNRTDAGLANRLEPGRARAAETCPGRPEDNAPPAFRGKDLRIPDATPEQLARVLLRGGAEPRPQTRTPAADR